MVEPAVGSPVTSPQGKPPTLPPAATKRSSRHAHSHARSIKSAKVERQVTEAHVRPRWGCRTQSWKPVTPMWFRLWHVSRDRCRFVTPVPAGRRELANGSSAPTWNACGTEPRSCPGRRRGRGCAGDDQHGLNHEPAAWVGAGQDDRAGRQPLQQARTRPRRELPAVAVQERLAEHERVGVLAHRQRKGSRQDRLVNEPSTS